MNWFETEDGTLINLDYIKYVTPTRAAFSKQITLNDSTYVDLSKNDYKKIRKKLLNEGEC